MLTFGPHNRYILDGKKINNKDKPVMSSCSVDGVYLLTRILLLSAYSSTFVLLWSIYKYVLYIYLSIYLSKRYKDVDIIPPFEYKV